METQINPSSTSLMIERARRFLAPTYSQFPVVFVRGKGTRLWDAQGREYIDFIGGIGACAVGHCHPAVVDAIQRQAEALLHVSNLYYVEPQIELAELLVQHTFPSKAFFCNSGAEAVEAAIKLARKYAKEKYGAQRYKIITLSGSFHGRTFGALSATGQERFHQGFEPLVPGFTYIPFGDIEAARAAFTPDVAAIMVEVIQGEGGVNFPPPDYLPRLRNLCNERGVLLVLDEIQTGMGRTGALFAYEHYGIKPDILTSAKSLGGGMAIGAMLASPEVADVFGPGSHASTFGGNPLACAAAKATLHVILEDGLLDNCRQAGEFFLEQARLLAKKFSFISDVRGLGLMIGMELDIEAPQVVKQCLELGALTGCAGNRVLRFLPPLLVTEGEVIRVIETLSEVFGKF